MAGALFFAYAFTLRVSPSVMVADLMSAFAVGGAVLGNLSAFYFYAYSGLQIPVGLLLDRVGPRRLMTGAALVVAAGAALFAAAPDIGSAYAGRLLVGAGCAFSWAGTLAIVNQWFPARFAVLAGASQLVAMGGAMLGQAPLAAVVGVVGWRAATGALAAIGLLLAMALWGTVRDRPRAGAGVSAGGARTVLRNPQTWLAAWFGLAMTAPMLAFGGLWGVPYLMAVHDLARADAAAIASLVFLGTGIGALVLGWWSDRVRRRKLPMLLAGAMSVGAQLCFLLLPGLPLPAVAALVFATGVGGASLVLALACGREHNALANAGLTIGIVNTAITGSGALMQPLIGWLLDAGWDGALVEGARVYAPALYGRALLVLPALGALGLLALAAIRETGARQQG